MACNRASQSPLTVKKILPKELKEISGIVADGKNIWVITDKPKSEFFRLDTSGNLLQTIQITNVQLTDVEAVTADSNYIYVGDLGDNNGDRKERQIVKVSANSIGKDDNAKVQGELITFIFPGEVEANNKKKNNYDCESLLSYKDSLYVFTKERDSNQTKLYAVPKIPGNYTATFIDSFNSKGLITDAAINQSNNEVALIGYHKNHQYPFIFLFKDFQGNDFFTGNQEHLELADKPWDWQLESISFKDDDMVYFACEGTKEVPATFYGIEKSKLKLLDKKSADKTKKDKKKDEEPHLSTKGHLKP